MSHSDALKCRSELGCGNFNEMAVQFDALLSIPGFPIELKRPYSELKKEMRDLPGGNVANLREMFDKMKEMLGGSSDEERDDSPEEGGGWTSEGSGESSAEQESSSEEEESSEEEVSIGFSSYFSPPRILRVYCSERTGSDLCGHFGALCDKSCVVWVVLYYVSACCV